MIRPNRDPDSAAVYPARNTLRQPGGSLGLDVSRDAGGAPGRCGNRVILGGPRDLPVVAFGIGEVRIAALEELRVRRFFRHGGTGRLGAPEEGVDVVASKYLKCERCWHYRADVGASAEHPGLCGRCISNLFGNGETRSAA